MRNLRIVDRWQAAAEGVATMRGPAAASSRHFMAKKLAHKDFSPKSVLANAALQMRTHSAAGRASGASNGSLASQGAQGAGIPVGKARPSHATVRAPKRMYLQLLNSLRDVAGGSDTPVCRITLAAPYWLDNRTGMDLVVQDRAAQEGAVNLKAPPEVRWRSFSAAVQGVHNPTICSTTSAALYVSGTSPE